MRATPDCSVFNEYFFVIMEYGIDNDEARRPYRVRET